MLEYLAPGFIYSMLKDAASAISRWRRSRARYSQSVFGIGSITAVHITASFPDWPCFDDNGSGGEHDTVVRAYEIWDHARACIEEDPSDFDRIDCIAALRRAINHRLKTLTAAYCFDSLPSLRPGKQALEKLQDYGLVRPALIRDLLAARNAVEHDDVEPPSVERCRYFVDVVWYFLKSTDGILRMRIDSVQYELDERCTVWLRVRPAEQWKVSLWAKLPAEMVSPVQDDARIEIADFLPVSQQASCSIIEFSGEALFRGEHLMKFARQYFGLAGYWYEDHV
jgi:hypothetical protein